MDIVIEKIFAAASRSSGMPAIISKTRTISHDELCRLILSIGRFLAFKRIARGTKVGLNIADADLFLLVTLACLHRGLVPFVLLDLRQLSGEADCALVIGSKESLDLDLANDFLIEEGFGGFASGEGDLGELPDRNDDELYFVATTTGTTGRPRLVAETYGEFRSRAPIRLDPAVGLANQSGLSAGRYASDDRVLLTIGDISKRGFSQSLHILMSGATLVRPRGLALETIKAIELYQVTRIETTPATIRLMTHQLELLGMRCPSVRTIRLSGSLFEPSLLEDIERHFDAKIIIGYGSAETHAVAGGTISSASYKPGYVGEILRGTQIISTGSPERPAPLTLINRPGFHASYYSKGKTVRNPLPFVDLPDLGYLIGTSLYLTGRSDEVLNFSGNKIAFAVIEAMLRERPEIIDVGLVGASQIGDPIGLIIGVVARPQPEYSALAQDLCSLIKTPLAAPHLYFVPIDAIARNATGKVDREEIVAAYRRSARAN